VFPTGFALVLRGRLSLVLRGRLVLALHSRHLRSFIFTGRPFVLGGGRPVFASGLFVLPRRFLMRTARLLAIVRVPFVTVRVA
jgi:hypothetical protein